MAYGNRRCPRRRCASTPLRKPPKGGQATRAGQRDGPAVAIEAAGEPRVRRRADRRSCCMSSSRDQVTFTGAPRPWRPRRPRRRSPAARGGRIRRRVLVWTSTFSGGRPVILRRVLRAAVWHLRGRPDVAAVGAHVGGAVHRLHGGVGEVRGLVDRLDLLRGAGQRGGGIALLARFRAGLRQRRRTSCAMPAVVMAAHAPSSHLHVENARGPPWRTRCCRRSRPRRSRSGPPPSRPESLWLLSRRSSRPCRRRPDSAPPRRTAFRGADVDAELRLAVDLERACRGACGGCRSSGTALGSFSGTSRAAAASPAASARLP